MDTTRRCQFCEGGAWPRRLEPNRKACSAHILQIMAEAQRVYLTAYLDKITQAIGKAGGTKKDGEIAVSMPAGLDYSVGVAGMPLDKLKDLNAKEVRRELKTGESGFIAK